jgi:Integrase core domain
VSSSCAAVAWYAERGVTIERVLSDNGNGYRSHAWATACAELGIARRYTRPRRPQTNGKAEALVKTLLREWAYRFAYPTSTHRARALPGYLRWYNHHRPHSSLGARPPISRVSQVRGSHNEPGTTSAARRGVGVGERESAGQWNQDLLGRLISAWAGCCCRPTSASRFDSSSLRPASRFRQRLPLCDEHHTAFGTHSDASHRRSLSRLVEPLRRMLMLGPRRELIQRVRFGRRGRRRRSGESFR